MTFVLTVKPASVAGAVLAEDVFQSGPRIRREWADGELHADLVSAPHNDPVHRAAAFR